jgi:ADP-ribosylglycohydrolase
MYYNKIKGCVFGLAISDAVGLRYENVKPIYINEKNIGKVCFGGSISDDTEHMFLISKSIVNSNNIDEFEKDFKNELKKRMISSPVNIGKTTLISIMRSLYKSGYGVKGTGNGSIMGISPVGLIFHNDNEKLK